jgi:propanol-preferring alcohol dehydrogenase
MFKASGFFHPGTFQQYLTASAKCVTPIPEGIDPAGAAPLMCAGVSVYAGLKRAHTKAGDWVLVSGGGGGLGHLAIQYAKAMGARVIAMDVRSKEDFCKEVGAGFFIDFTKFGADEDITAEVKRIVPGGVKIVLCCVGSRRAYLQAQKFLGPRGALVCLGIPVIPVGEPTALFELGPLVMNELNIIGRRICILLSKHEYELIKFAGMKSGSRQEAKECLDIAASGLVKTRYQLRSMDSLTQVSKRNYWIRLSC